MIQGLCEIFIMGLHKISYLKVCLNGSAVSCPDILIMNLMQDKGLSLFIAFKVILKWQHICGKFQLVASQAISFCGRYVSHMATTTRNTLGCIILQNRERLHCSSQKIIETIDWISYRCRQRQGNYTLIWSDLIL